MTTLLLFAACLAAAYWFFNRPDPNTPEAISDRDWHHRVNN